MRIATPEYEALLADVSAALGPTRKPLLIAVDGKGDTRKSTLSNWLAWQLGVPAIHLDLFSTITDTAPITRRVADLDRCIKARGNRPLIVEGVLLLDALDEVGRSPGIIKDALPIGHIGSSPRLHSYNLVS